MTQNKHSQPRNIGSGMEQSKQDAKRQTLVCAVPYLLPWLCGSRMCASVGFLPLPPCCFCTPHGPVLRSTSHLLPMASLGRCPMSLVTIFQCHTVTFFALLVASSWNSKSSTYQSLGIPRNGGVVGAPLSSLLYSASLQNQCQVDNTKVFHYNTALCSPVEMLLSRKRSLINESKFFILEVCGGEGLANSLGTLGVSFYYLNTKLGFFLMILISLTTIPNLFATFKLFFSGQTAQCFWILLLCLL